MNHVCAHVKRGICDTCAEPLKPRESEHSRIVSPFGAALITACRKAGIPTRPADSKKNRRRNRNRSHN